MRSSTADKSAVCEWLATQREPMIALLRGLVNIDGGSYDKAGVDAGGREIGRCLESHGISTEVIPDATYGDSIRAIVPSSTDRGGANSNILLLGRRDTVFPKGEPSRRP